MVTVTLAALITAATAASAGDIYGEIRLRDLETGDERPISRQVKITLETKSQRIETTSRPGASYYFGTDQEGRFPIQVEWRGMKLVDDVGVYYNPNRYDLVIETKHGEYRLVATFVREYRSRPHN